MGLKQNEFLPALSVFSLVATHPVICQFMPIIMEYLYRIMSQHKSNLTFNATGLITYRRSKNKAKLGVELGTP